MTDLERAIAEAVGRAPGAQARRFGAPLVLAAALALLAIGGGFGYVIGRSASPEPGDSLATTRVSASPTPSPTPTEATYASAGIFDLYADNPGDIKVTGDECKGAGGYSDIDVVTQAVMRDQTGTIIEAPNIGQGTLVTEGGRRICRYAFTFLKVPRAATNLTVEIGRRGAVTFDVNEVLNRGVNIQIGADKD